MTDKMLVLLGLILIYFHISGLATTNILRLTAGSTLPVLAGKCCCEQCGARIPALLQLPMISYLVCRGKCRSCGAKIPLFPLMLEVAVFAGMSVISLALRAGFLGVSLSYLFYEAVRLAAIARLGKRETGFGKQYAIAVLAMVPFYILTLFVALLYHIV